MMSCLEVKNLSKVFGKNSVLEQVNFLIGNNEAVGFLGANGAGKSTLIKCILGLIKPSSGTIHYIESPAYLAELAQLPTSLSAQSLISYKCHSTNHPLSAIKASLDEFKLPESARNRSIRTYSKGMRQRTALAFTLCNNPKLILLDEPMSGLDALGRAEALVALKHRKDSGATIVMSSHIVSDMVQLCDRVLIMAHGKLCEEITIDKHSLDEVKLLEEKLKYWTESIL